MAFFALVASSSPLRDRSNERRLELLGLNGLFDTREKIDVEARELSRFAFYGQLPLMFMYDAKAYRQS